MRGRPREFDREGALDAAMQLFWRKGYLATSMNDLCEAMGIASPSLYAAFGSKEALYVEAVQRYNAGARVAIWDHMDDGPTVKASLKKLLLGAAHIMSGESALPTGCLVNLAAGQNDDPSPVAEASRDARQGGLDTLRAGLTRAVANGELPRATNVERLARFYLGTIQGMAIQARDGATLDEMQGMVDVAMAAWPGKP